MSGADYSYARPGGAALAAAGVTDVGRYLAADGRGITGGEYQDLIGHGINVWFVREGAATGMLGAYPRGVADAQIALQQLAAAGVAGSPVVFAAADWDVQDSQLPQLDAYMQGFASVLGLNRTGIYAGLHYCNHAHAMGLAVRFWEAGATSWNHSESAQEPISFIQTTDTPPLPGMDVDIVLDPSLASLGALPLGGFLMSLDDTQQRQIYEALVKGGESPSAYYTPDAIINIIRDELKPIVQAAADALLKPSPASGQYRPIDVLVSQVPATLAAVSRSVQRDGVTVSQADDNAATGTLVRQLVAQLAALQAAVGLLTSGTGADTAAVQAAAQAGAQAALANLTLKAA